MAGRNYDLDPGCTAVVRRAKLQKFDVAGKSIARRFFALSRWAGKLKHMTRQLTGVGVYITAQKTIGGENHA